ncbi:Uncharacterised protein [Vibrio cholerae]|nr:Uncharacterised protein [Vibrio cholerae]
MNPEVTSPNKMAVTSEIEIGNLPTQVASIIKAKTIRLSTNATAMLRRSTRSVYAPFRHSQKRV